ncbi:unnamed protein product [Protopolystoma xenopodis]|uniref:Uncharacterized protein n=1 Tax=Protopolystoma xenopodis TaxID=117903 RepID=A0A3S5AXK0_9PLAT|nr:unnamed protein product [Protopolystoma xenopodis]
MEMDTERSEIAENIAQTGHKINRQASYGENTKKWTILEAIDILEDINLMNMKMEGGRVSNNFAYCLSKCGENKDTIGQAKRRRLDQGSNINQSKRDRKEEEDEGV